MSKSYNNTIDIFDDPATIRKKVKKIVTDSTPVEAPKNPDTCPLFNLYKLFAAPDELAEVERRYREGGIGYGEVKTRLGEAMIARFAPARERRADWLAHPGASRRGPRRRRRPSQNRGPRRSRPRPGRVWSGVNLSPPIRPDTRHKPVYETRTQVYNNGQSSSAGCTTGQSRPSGFGPVSSSSLGRTSVFLHALALDLE